MYRRRRGRRSATFLGSFRSSTGLDGLAPTPHFSVDGEAAPLQHGIYRVRRDVQPLNGHTVLAARHETIHAIGVPLEGLGIVVGDHQNLEPQRLGLGFVAFILVSGTAERYLEEEFLARPEVEEVAGITGEYDLLLKVRLPSLEDFNTFLMDFRDRYDAYLDKTITMVRTANLKE